MQQRLSPSAPPKPLRSVPQRFPSCRAQDHSTAPPIVDYLCSSAASWLCASGPFEHPLLSVSLRLDAPRSDPSLGLEPRPQEWVLLVVLYLGWTRGPAVSGNDCTYRLSC